VDPLVSLIVVAVIVWGTWDLLRQSLAMSLSAVPPAIEPADVRGHLEALPGVSGLHDLHIWPMSTTEVALTCHLIMPAGHPGDAFLMRTAHDLRECFDIGHATLQIETGVDSVCALAPDRVV
jgi:cobalt-zinc-cadmium efflux system protein